MGMLVGGCGRELTSGIQPELGQFAPTPLYEFLGQRDEALL